MRRPDAGLDVQTHLAGQGVVTSLPLVVEAYLAMLAEQRRVSPHTLAAYRHDLQMLVTLAANVQDGSGQSGVALEKLQVHHLRRFMAQMHGQGRSGRTLGRVLSGWRGLYQWFGKTGQVMHNPCVGIRPPKSVKRLPSALSPDEAARLLDAGGEQDDEGDGGAEGAVGDEGGTLATRDSAMFELFYSSGLRLAELAALNLDCLTELSEGEVRVTGKRSKTRVVPVGRKACEAIALWLTHRPEMAAQEESALFVSRRGQRLSMRAIQSRLAQRGQLAGLSRRVHPHMLRHSFASHVLQSSGDLRAVQEMLGHASIASTQVYTHLDFQHLAKVYDQAHPRAKRK